MLIVNCKALLYIKNLNHKAILKRAIVQESIQVYDLVERWVLKGSWDSYDIYQLCKALETHLWGITNDIVDDIRSCNEHELCFQWSWPGVFKTLGLKEEYKPMAYTHVIYGLLTIPCSQVKIWIRFLWKIWNYDPKS